MTDDLRERVHPAFIETFDAERTPRSYTAEQFIDAFLSRVVRDSDHLIWTGTASEEGYGHVSVHGRMMGAHRAAMWMANGIKPPTELHIDHLCRRPPCVEPVHLELVLPEENNARGFSPTGVNGRKTHCKHGHEFTPENTRICSRGGRNCRECNRQRARRDYWRAKEQGGVAA